MKEAFWIIDQLVQQGISHFCISPGSRSTPLAIAAAEQKRAKTYVHYDERGLGFFGLGLAKALQKPVAVIVTSGTAVANVIPSALEAHHASIPLLFLTADRPPEQLGCSSNQATEFQTALFSPYVRWQVNLPPVLEESYFRSCMAHAVYFSQKNPPGPVHINVQLREPLYTPCPPAPPGKPLHLTYPKQRVDASQLQQWASCEKGVILIGKLPSPEDLFPILQLAKELQWPIFADLLSNARLYPTFEQISHFDWILKGKKLPQPDLILHFGERLVAKKILEWVGQAPLVHVSPFPCIQDPARTMSAKIQSDISSFCTHFEAKRNESWLSSWKQRDAQIEALLQTAFQKKGPLTEAHAMRTLSTCIPSDFSLFLGNSMPIRDADHFFFPSRCKALFANRGLSGIDGNLATAAGLAEGLQSPLLAWIGDQACLHDLNSLPFFKKTTVPIYLFASNNFGGGIFSHLPIGQSPYLETFFAATHPWRFEKAAQMFDLPYVQTTHLSPEFLHSLFEKRSSMVVELQTDRAHNYAFQKEILETCSQLPF